MNTGDLTRDKYMLNGPLAANGYDWWWHSFTGYNATTGEEKAFYIEFFIINPKESPNEIVYGQLPQHQRKGRKPSYVMVNVGTWGKDHRQLHAFYPFAMLKCNDKRLHLVVGENRLSETYTCGKVTTTQDQIKDHPEYMSDVGSMKWELRINKKISYNVGYGASKFFRNLNAFEMFWHAQGMKTEYEGIVILDNEVYNIIPERSYGYADKNWGKDYTSPWIWISSCNMTSLRTGQKLENSVIEVGGGRPKVFGIPLDRKLLIEFYYEGKEYEFNFSKFWSRVNTKFHCGESGDYVKWSIVTENRTHVLKIKCRCKKDHMLKINYEAPNGLKLHNNLWNGGDGQGELFLYKKCKGHLELVDRITFKNAGCEYGEYDLS